MNSSMSGRPIAELLTPALLVDLPTLQRNIDTMQSAARRSEVELRPHIKAHKTPQIARMQLDAGAAGITAAKVSEAEAMLPCGAEEVFIANEVVGRARIERMVALGRQVHLSAAVDSVAVATRYSEVFHAAGQTLDVVIEIDIGAGRCGVPPSQAPNLALSISDLPGIELVGIMCYTGGAYSARGAEAFEAAAAAEARTMSEAAAVLRQQGYSITRVSGGSTPTGPYYRRGCGLTEFRSGTYALNDMNQVDLGAARVEDVAATILTTVISTPRADRVITDAGSKALATQVSPISPGCGWVKDDLGTVVEILNDEHGYLNVRRAMRRYQVGDVIEIIPPRICTALNLFDTLYLREDGRIVDELPIAARGKSQ